MIHLELFWSFFQIGLFSIGGGYAAMPLIQHQVVELHPWLTLEQFSDIITISQMTPGPIAINSATFVGLQLGGLPGALVATAGCVLPSCIIVLTLAYVYYRYRGLSMVQGVLAGPRPPSQGWGPSSSAAARTARRGLCCTRCCKALRPNGKNRPGRQNVRGGFCIVWQRNAAGTAGAGPLKKHAGKRLPYRLCRGLGRSEILLHAAYSLKRANRKKRKRCKKETFNTEWNA